LRIKISTRRARNRELSQNVRVRMDLSRSRADAIVGASRRLRVYFTFLMKKRVSRGGKFCFLQQFTLRAKIRVRPPARQLCLPSQPNSQGRRLTDARTLSGSGSSAVVVSPFLQFVSSRFTLTRYAARCFLFIFNAVDLPEPLFIWEQKRITHSRLIEFFPFS
jgi:hypothetical protein